MVALAGSPRPLGMSHERLAEDKHDHIIDLTTGKARPFLPRDPTLSSANGPWEGFRLEQYADGKLDRCDVLFPHLSLFVRLTHGMGVEYGTGASPRASRAGAPGAVTILPPMTSLSGSARGTGDFLLLTVEPGFWSCAVSSLLGAEPSEIIPRHGIVEPFVRAVADALMSEAEAGYPGGRLYGDALCTALAVHVARHHSIPRTAPPLHRAGLSAGSLRRVVEFVDQRLQEDLTLARLAGVAGLSPFHFARMFKRSAGVSVHRFVVRRRVERARELLLLDGASIADIAARVGFCDQSHLSVHFKRLCGISPGEFVKHTRPWPNGVTTS
jgi:AraC family transcriptional regulator